MPRPKPMTNASDAGDPVVLGSGLAGGIGKAGSILKWLLNALMTASIGKSIYDTVADEPLGGRSGAEKSALKLQELQNTEIAKFETAETAQVAGRKRLAESYPDPQGYLDTAALLNTGLFDKDLVEPQDPADSLVAYVSKNLGMTERELALRTRPPNNPFRTLGIEEKNGY